MDIGVADEIVEVVFIAVAPQQRSSVTAAAAHDWGAAWRRADRGKLVLRTLEIVFGWARYRREKLVIPRS